VGDNKEVTMSNVEGLVVSEPEMVQNTRIIQPLGKTAFEALAQEVEPIEDNQRSQYTTRVGNQTVPDQD
jgi:hypothetical protein